MEEYLGQIQSESDPSGIDRERWVQLIGKRSAEPYPPGPAAPAPWLLGVWT